MTSTASPPDYYAILEVPAAASTDQIRNAYKRAALKTHPDRVPTESPERPVRTRKFQLVNDAYFVLSDPSRRRDYDAQRNLFGTGSSPADDPFASAGADPSQPGRDGGSGGGGDVPKFYSWAWNFFTKSSNAGPNTEAEADADEARRRAEEAQFGDVFEEMLREEGMADGAAQGAGGAPASNGPLGAFWGMVGGVSGATLGFIVANMPGLVAGAVAGNRLGAIRDAKGKSVYSVFQELPADDRARLLSQLAAKVFSHAVGI